MTVKELKLKLDEFDDNSEIIIEQQDPSDWTYLNKFGVDDIRKSKLNKFDDEEFLIECDDEDVEELDNLSDVVVIDLGLV